MLHSEALRLLENSKLYICVPSSPVEDLAIFNDSSDAGNVQDVSSAVEGISQRQTFFLDEIMNALVVLHIPKVDNDAFEAFKELLAVSLECFSVGSRRSGLADEKGSKAMTIKDLVCTWTNTSGKVSSDSISKSSPEDAVRSSGTNHIAWKVEMHLSRTRIRSTNAYMYLTAAATIKNHNSSSSAADIDEYMTSGVAASVNLLDGLQTDPAFEGNAPVLPASRLSKILPTGVESRDQPQSLRCSTRNPIRLVPAFRSRMRCPRVGATPDYAKIFACLDIDIAPFIDRDIDLERPQLSLSDGGAVHALIEPSAQSFPLRCSSEDSVSFVYSLTPARRRAPSDTIGAPHTINVTLDASISLSDAHVLRLRSSFRISVDLSSLQLTSHNIPTNTSLPKPLPNLPRTSRTSHDQPSTTTATSRDPTEPSLSHLFTATISSPPRAIVSATLTWSLHIANRSKTRTLDLAIIPLTHSHTSAPTPRVSQPSQSQVSHNPRRHSLTMPASNPDANAAAAAGVTPPPNASNEPPYQHQEPQPLSLIVQTPDVRTGPIAPGAATSVTVCFTPLRPGVLRVLALRVVDLGASAQPNAVDGGRKPAAYVDLSGALLPDVFAVNATDNEGDGDS